ncbi:hypothetical protein KBB06_01060 [Candidatus Gracilibacteria bacterium]|nr:hypothetical protein [Candidatus Gracilibacteria bacterium]
MKTAENIKKIALIFFFILGTLHIVSGLMTANNYLMPLSLILNRILDIPFAITALIYGLSSIFVTLPPQNHKLANIFFSILTIIIFLGLLYINLLVPDKPSMPEGQDQSSQTQNLVQ